MDGVCQVLFCVLRIFPEHTHTHTLSCSLSIHIYVYMCVCVCVWVCVYIYIYIYIIAHRQTLRLSKSVRLFVARICYSSFSHLNNNCKSKFTLSVFMLAESSVTLLHHSNTHTHIQKTAINSSKLTVIPGQHASLVRWVVLITDFVASRWNQCLFTLHKLCIHWDVYNSIALE